MCIKDIYLLQRSEQFTLAPRQEITIDLSLKKVRKEFCTVLMGCVNGKCGQVEGATVKVFDKNNNPIAHTVTDQNGKFIFDNILEPGKYKVLATAEEYKVSCIYRVKLKPRKPVSICIKLIISDLKNLATVYGVVYNEANVGLEGAKIIIKDYDESEVLTQTNADGEFLAYGLKPKKYWISASKEGYFLPQKISFELDPNEILCINLFLYLDGTATNGTVSGEINSNGQSVSNAVVALYKVDEKNHVLLETKETNNSGLYLFPDVKPGEYLIKSKIETEQRTDE